MNPNAPKLITPTGEALTGGPKVSAPPIVKQTKEPDTPERDWSKVQFPIQLFGDKIAIRRDDREEMTEGGLIIPDNAQVRSMTGVVVAAGPGFQKGDGSHIPMVVAVGDTVVFEQFRQMTELRVEGRNYHVMNANDLLGKVIGGVKVKSPDAR
jgi:chaperonin GroES